MRSEIAHVATTVFEGNNATFHGMFKASYYIQGDDYFLHFWQLSFFGFAL